MARKTKEDAQKSRDQILDAAEHVFYHKGFTLATMSDIAETAQLSRGAVYGHYKSKLEVAIAMAERVINQVAPFAPEPTISALTNLKQYCLNEIQSCIHPSSLQRVLFFLYIGIDDSPQLLNLRFVWEKKRIKQIGQLLQQAIAQGELSPKVDIEMLNLYCQSLIEGIFSVIYFGNFAESERWKHAEQLCDFAMQYLVIRT